MGGTKNYIYGFGSSSQGFLGGNMDTFSRTTQIYKEKETERTKKEKDTRPAGGTEMCVGEGKGIL